MSSPGGTPGTGVGGFLLRRLFGSAISNAVGYALGTAISPTLEPLVQDLENTTWEQFPNMPLSASQAAQLALRDLTPYEAGAAEARLTGYEPGRFALLRRLAGESPTLDTLFSLRRRGVIDEGQLDAGIAQLGYLDEWRPLVKRLRFVLPSVTDLVHMAVREVFDPGKRAALDLDAEFPPEFADRAAEIGISPALARDYWADHWQLPSYEQGVAMLYRGEISQGEFETLLAALDYAPTWRGPLQTIAAAIPPISDMLRFMVREVYTQAVRDRFQLDADFPEQAIPEGALHGMAPERMRQYWAAHWRLPSAQQGYRMLHRGEIDAPDLKLLLRSLDYSPFWRDKLQNIAYLVPGRVDLRRMFRFGVISRAEVKAGYQRLGYTAEDAETLTKFAEAEKASTGRQATLSDKARTGLYSTAHGEFMDASLDDAGARSVLAQLGATPEEATDTLQLWLRERELYRRELTPAQLRKLFKAGVRTEAEALQALTDMGYDVDDATDFLLT